VPEHEGSIIGLSSLWLRLFTRLRTKAGMLPRPAYLLDTVQPVTDIDDLLRVASGVTVARDLQAAAGTFTTYWTVPAGEKWRLMSVWREGTTAVTRIALNMSGTFARISISATDELAILPTGIILDELDSIGMYTTGDVGDASRSMDMSYLRELSYPTPAGPGVE